PKSCRMNVRYDFSQKSSGGAWPARSPIPVGMPSLMNHITNEAQTLFVITAALARAAPLAPSAYRPVTTMLYDLFESLVNIMSELARSPRCARAKSDISSGL